MQLLKESGPSPQLLVSLTPLAANESDEDYAVVSASLTEKVIEISYYRNNLYIIYI